MTLMIALYLISHPKGAVSAIGKTTNVEAAGLNPISSQFQGFLQTYVGNSA
ncbi:MAG: hypothetical protein AAF623_01130 [Planctomycetota bacterium]